MEPHLPHLGRRHVVPWGLAGVAVAYILYARRNKAPLGDLCDGLSLATPLGLGVVRLANYINAEHYGTLTDLPWATKFPKYFGRPEQWDGTSFTEPRHPSQIYEALGEGLLLYFVLRFLMLKLKWGGGRIGGAFLIGYGIVRFVLEYVREPDKGLGEELGWFTRGQQLSLVMMVAGALVFWFCRKRNTRPRRYDPDTGESTGFLDEEPSAA